MKPEHHHVVVFGASPKPGRYANMAQRLLMEKGYRVSPVHPRATHIEGIAVINQLDAIIEPVHTLTLYVGPQRLEPQIDALMALAPQRVIFNPGSESERYQQRLQQADIEWIEGCTLVMLKTGTF